jgi:hypothetical protein
VDYISGSYSQMGRSFLLTPQKNWEKYISIPHSRFKLQNICSSQKTNTTTSFVASFYLKMTVSTPRSESDTFRYKRHPCLGFHATAYVINEWLCIKMHAQFVLKDVQKSVKYGRTWSASRALSQNINSAPFLYKNCGN